jgi:hypothetical protein
MAFPHSGSFWSDLSNGISPGRACGNGKQSLKQCRHTPRMRGIQYAAAAVVDGGIGVYWIIRWSLSFGRASRDPLADDDRGTNA